MRRISGFIKSAKTALHALARCTWEMKQLSWPSRALIPSSIIKLWVFSFLSG